MSKRKIGRRAAVRIVSYAGAALLALSLFSAVSYGHLLVYRRQTKVDADRAFEETVNALDALSLSLEKSLYALDGPMCARICAEAYADAGRAGTALSALPFSTVEMEELKRFISLSGDYAYTLCREAAEEGFDQEQLGHLLRLSETAAALADELRGMRGELSDGALRMDSREAQVANILERAPALLSERLGDYAREFPAAEPISYHGQYSARAEEAPEPVDETQAREQAAALLNCDPEELQTAASYEDGSRLLLTAGSRTLSFRSGVLESLRDSRLVSESLLSEEEARAAAEEALRALGVDAPCFEEGERRGNIQEYRCSTEADGVTALDREIGVAIALDDGSLYALSLPAPADEAAETDWGPAAEEAAARLPAGLRLLDTRRVTIRGADGRSIPCLELRCENENGRQIRIYCSVETGKQEEILLS